MAAADPPGPGTLEFPSLEFFRALQERTRLDAPRFEKLGYCDTAFGVGVGGRLYSIVFRISACVEVHDGGDPERLDFVLSGEEPVWRSMLESIRSRGGARSAHTLMTLTHLDGPLRHEARDAAGSDKLYRYMATLQEFFDQAQHVAFRCAS